MFEDLDWKAALKRGVIFVGIYLLSMYVLSTASPEYFDLGLATSADISGFAITVAFLFLFIVFISAFTDRTRRRTIARRRAEAKAAQKAGQRKGRPGAAARTDVAAESDANGDGAVREDLSGRRNPNTSRKKTARRRRR